MVHTGTPGVGAARLGARRTSRGLTGDLGAQPSLAPASVRLTSRRAHAGDSAVSGQQSAVETALRHQQRHERQQAGGLGPSHPPAPHSPGGGGQLA